MDRNCYGVYINLASMYGVEVEEREVDGRVQKVAVIPLKENGITSKVMNGKRGLYVYGAAYPAQANPFNQTHYIKVKPFGEESQKLRQDLGLKPSYTLGNMKFGFWGKNYDSTEAKANSLDGIL